MSKFILITIYFSYDLFSFSRSIIPDVALLGSTFLQPKRLCSTAQQRTYSERDFVTFPKLSIPVEEWPTEQNTDIFIPPTGRHYSHNVYNMNLYEPAKKLFGEETFQRLTSSRSNEAYLFPGGNCPKLVRDFSSLPFSASGSLWAYRNQQDYDDDNKPCWSGSASLLTPYCAITAAHCLVSDEPGATQPALYAFVLHHYGSDFATKRKCTIINVPTIWNILNMTEKKSNQENDYGLVFFLPISDCKYGVLSIRNQTESLLHRSIQVTGYPGDSIELRARKLWPDNLSSTRFQYLWNALNEMPLGMRRFVYDRFNRMVFLEDNTYAGCLMFASPGKVIKEYNGMVSYNANTFPGQNGGNGVEEIILTHKDGQNKGVILDFLHTLGSQTQSQENSGVKIEGNVLAQILKWVNQATRTIEDQIRRSNKKTIKKNR